MSQAFESSLLLLEIWRDVNKECFDSQLIEPSSIGWIDLSTEEQIEEPFGIYFSRLNSIAISRRFHSLEGRCATLKIELANISLTTAEKEALLAKIGSIIEICYRLVAHEAIHQAVLQFGGTTRSHGEEFVAQATRVAKVHGIAPPTISNAHCWPEVDSLIALENTTGTPDA